MANSAQTYVHQINGHPVAASEVVPNSGLGAKIGAKADKVTDGTAGDLVALDATGNLVDANVDLQHLVKDAYLSGSDGTYGLVNAAREAVLTETTEEEIRSIIDAL